MDRGKINGRGLSRRAESDDEEDRRVPDQGKQYGRPYILLSYSITCAHRCQGLQLLELAARVVNRVLRWLLGTRLAVVPKFKRFRMMLTRLHVKVN